MTESDVFGRSPFVSCPSCGAVLAEHEYVDLCEAPASQKREDDVERLVDEERWLDLARLVPERAGQEFVLRALRCPSGKGALVPLRLSPTIYGDDEVSGLVHCLDSRSVANLSAALPRLAAAWRPYAATWVNRAR